MCHKLDAGHGEGGFVATEAEEDDSVSVCRYSSVPPAAKREPPVGGAASECGKGLSQDQAEAADGVAVVSAQGGKVVVKDESEDLVRVCAPWLRRLPRNVGSSFRSERPVKQIADAEAMLGYALHPLLRRLYLEIANGGFGPDGWRLMPVERLTMCLREPVGSSDLYRRLVRYQATRARID